METTKGERLAYANSIWVYINTETGMPVRPGQEEINVYKLETPLEMEYEPRKIKLSREWEDKEAVKVQRSWIDSNEHVNNSWYVKTAFEQLPQDQRSDNFVWNTKNKHMKEIFYIQDMQKKITEYWSACVMRTKNLMQ